MSRQTERRARLDISIPGSAAECRVAIEGAGVRHGGLAFTDPDHQAALDELRGERRRQREPEVQLRPLARYDALIPA